MSERFAVFAMWVAAIGGMAATWAMQGQGVDIALRMAYFGAAACMSVALAYRIVSRGGV